MTSEGPAARPALRKSFLRDYVATGSLLGITKLRGVIVAALVVRTFGLAEYGAYALGMTAAQLLTAAATFGLGTALVVEWPRLRPADRRGVVSRLAAGTGLLGVAAAGLWALALLGTQWYDAPSANRHVAAALAVVAPCAAVQAVAANAYRAMGRLAWFSASSSVRSVAEVGVLVATSLSGASLVWLAWWVVIVQAIVAGAAVAVAVRAVGRHAGPTNVGPGIGARDIARASVPVGVVSLGRAVTDRADRFVLAGVLTPTALGLYSTSYAIASAVYSLADPVNSVLLTRLRDPWLTNRSSAVRELCRRLRWPFVGIGAAAVATMALLPVLSLIVLDASLTTVVADATALLVVGAVVYVHGNVRFLPALLDREPRQFLMPYWIGGAANISATLVLANAFDVRGAAFASVVGYGAMLVVAMHVQTKASGLPAREGSLILLISIAAVLATAGLIRP